MFKNYFKTAWRNLLRNKTFSTIKVLGLSIGLTVCMLIFLYTKDENSYDRFHENEAHLYRVTQNLNISGQPVQTVANTNAIVGETFLKEIPEVQQFVRVRSVSATMKKSNDVTISIRICPPYNYFTPPQPQKPSVVSYRI